MAKRYDGASPEADYVKKLEAIAHAAWHALDDSADAGDDITIMRQAVGNTKSWECHKRRRAVALSMHMRRSGDRSRDAPSSWWHEILRLLTKRELCRARP